VLRALEDAALVAEVEQGRRLLRLERPAALLDAWLARWQRRRISTRQWDIGARDPEEALSLLAEAAADRADRADPAAGEWAVGGLAGAAAVRRAVEPAQVLVWASVTGADALAGALHPAPARGATRGAVRVSLAPDPWILSLADHSGRVPVADPVQLWLDCASEGERSLEAAAAVADAMGWA
jgi:hypothetical protein